ncbi:MAG: hypothetical protein HZB33_12195 [Nitrospirae bacterium]|nr:hypothetical protein [Nitrospirota bacterium]
MLKAKLSDEVSLTLPPGLAKKLALKEGDTVKVLVEKGRLVFLDKKDKGSNIMQYAGIWQEENVDKIFLEMRKSWNKWQKNLSA